MFDIFSLLVVVFCVCVICWSYSSAIKNDLELQQSKANEAAAHRILMKLAVAHRMSDTERGLEKAIRLRELKVEVLNYASSIESNDVELIAEDSLSRGSVVINLKRSSQT